MRFLKRRVLPFLLVLLLIVSLYLPAVMPRAEAVAVAAPVVAGFLLAAAAAGIYFSGDPADISAYVSSKLSTFVDSAGWAAMDVFGKLANLVEWNTGISFTSSESITIKELLNNMLSHFTGVTSGEGVVYVDGVYIYDLGFVELDDFVRTNTRIDDSVLGKTLYPIASYPGFNFQVSTTSEPWGDQTRYRYMISAYADDQLMFERVNSSWSYSISGLSPFDFRWSLCVNGGTWGIASRFGNVGSTHQFHSVKGSQFIAFLDSVMGISRSITLDRTLANTDIFTIPEEKSITITGYPSAEAVLEQVATGTLTDVQVKVGEAVVVDPVDPPPGDIVLPPGEIADLSDLAITKFPFSIPWDFARGIKLLAAPAKAPYWEIDLFGGRWGTSAIILDFEQFSTLAAVCRWMETIFFCGALAMLTKRLLWTA